MNPPMQCRLPALLAILALGLAFASPALIPSAAQADSGGATIRSLPESEELRASVEVRHECPGYAYGPTESCNWFGEASAYGAGAGCPVVFDLSHSIWVGAAERYPGISSGTVAFSTFLLPRVVIVCMYVNAGTAELVGESHPFDRAAGREILPRPPEAEALPSRHEKCGNVRFHRSTYRVFIRRGYQSCALSRHTIARFLFGPRTEHGGRNAPDSAKYWTLSGGWRCKQGTGGAYCIRGGPANTRRAYEWIEANN
jgi:hypothetical protein